MVVVKQRQAAVPYVVRPHLVRPEKRRPLLKLPLRVTPKPDALLKPLQKTVRLPQPPLPRVNETPFRRVRKRLKPVRPLPCDRAPKQLYKKQQVRPPFCVVKKLA